MTPSKELMKQKLFNIIPNNTIDCIGWDASVDEDGALFIEPCSCDTCKAVYVAEQVTNRELETDLLVDDNIGINGRRLSS